MTLPPAEGSDSISLEDMALTADTIKAMSVEDLEDSLLTVIMADSTLFVRFLYSQGYDLWLTQTRFPSKPSVAELAMMCNISLLEKLKQLVEIDMCQEQKLVTSLGAHQLRVTSLLA